MNNNITIWLDETAARLPDKVGYADEHGEWTFSEIREAALNLALEMTDRGMFRRPVAIYMDKRVEVILSMFAAAYSGNFYTPIDVSMPANRVAKIMEILKPELIITRKALADGMREFAPEEIPAVFVDDISREKCGREEEILRGRERCCDTDLLYVLFTSGSTGTPKGVTICHRSVMDYIESLVELLGLSEDDVMGNQAPFYFDNSITDIYTAMKTGCRTWIIPEKLFSWPAMLLDFLEEKKIGTILWVPTVLISISRFRALKNREKLAAQLKRVLCCGEVMPNKHLNYWRKNAPGPMYANLYGPTEITDVCTVYIVDREFSDDEPLPIGKPMRNSDVFLLDEENRLITDEEGGIGEICVRGTCLSRGYYNNPEKTEAAFTQNPLNTAYQERIYRTGDLAKYNEYGEIMYLSRKDFQIKHMGFRIELGEIETAVSSIPEISLNCCLYDTVKGRIVLFTEGQFTLEEMVPKLKKMLPDYMIPGRLVCLDKMPLNANGKIDRTRLKEML